MVVLFRISNFCCALLLSGCVTTPGLFETKTPKERLQEKFAKYEVLMAANLDEHGWLKFSCDAVLFNGLYLYSGGKPNLYLAESKEEPGRWYRTPNHDCYPNHSASSISRDMYLGIMMGLWKNKDLSAFQRMVEYGDRHFWLVGDGFFTTVSIMPDMQATIFMLMQDVGGKFNVRQLVPYMWSPYTAAYVRHLNLLHLYMRGELKKGLSAGHLEILKNEIEQSPNNALIQAIYHRHTDGDQSLATEILLREDLFPSDRLPESKDHCADYLWQRFEEEWVSCPERHEVHSGVDFLFAAKVVLQ